jgi:hypothetical protein
MTGDHRRDDAMELCETLLWYGELPDGNETEDYMPSGRGSVTTEGWWGQYSL